MVPSLIGGAVVPLAVYYLVRHQVSGDAPALAIAGIPAAGWVGVTWVRRGKLDPIGAITLFGFIVGLAASYAMGGSAFVLKVRDSALTCLFGLVCLASLRVGRRPLMFYFGRALSAGGDEIRERAFDELWELPPAQAAFRVITAVWGVGLLCEAAVRVVLARLLPTGPFLAASPAVAGVFFGGLFAFTVWHSRRARQIGEEAQTPHETVGASPLDLP